MNPVHFSSASEEWSTPQDLFDRLNEEFGFTLDAAANFESGNAKCATALNKGIDALSVSWLAYPEGDPGGAVWLNPPYGRGMGDWIAKAAETAQHGRTVVCLLPARTDTRWFHAHIWDAEKQTPRPGVEVRFLPGRLKFGGSKNSAPFPSCVVVFRGYP